MKRSLMDNVGWCMKQKSGLRITAPSNNLCKAYLKKAEDSLVSMNANFKANIMDWTTVAAYYTRYFALYALMIKCGIRCEIHDCTIKAMLYLFVQEDMIPHKLYAELEKSKEQRIDVQYYIKKEASNKEVIDDIKSAKAFLLEMEEIIEQIDEKQIAVVRDKLKKNIP